MTPDEPPSVPWDPLAACAAAFVETVVGRIRSAADALDVNLDMPVGIPTVPDLERIAGELGVPAMALVPPEAGFRRRLRLPRG